MIRPMVVVMISVPVGILFGRAVRMHVALGQTDPNALVEVDDVMLEREQRLAG